MTYKLNGILLDFLNYYYYFETQGLSPRQECTGTITTRHSLDLSDSGNPPTLASQVVGIISTCHYAQLIFVGFFVEKGFAMLPRLVSNPCAQVISLPWTPKVLGLQE